MNIKWNWGTKLLIAMILFMGMLVGMVVLSTRHSIMLVEKDYYPKGLKYQDRLDEISNAGQYAAELRIYQQADNIIITLPEINPDTGSIVFFRSSDNNLDRTFLLLPHTMTSVSFPKKEFTKGKYLVKIYWRQNSKGYYIEKPYYFN